MMHVSSSIVRTAGPQDAEAVMALCERLHAENGLFVMSPEKVAAKVLGILRKDIPGIVGIIGTPEHLEGIIILEVASMWYTDEQHLEELINYVPPEHRKTAHAKSLIEFAKVCGDETGLPLLIGVQSTERMEAKVRLYRRQLPKLGEFFMYPMKEAS